MLLTGRGVWGLGGEPFLRAFVRYRTLYGSGRIRGILTGHLCQGLPPLPNLKRQSVSQAALAGGHCPGAVPGAGAQQADPDPGVVGALIKGCQWLVGGAGAP